MRSFAAFYFIFSPVLGFSGGIGSLNQLMISNNDPYFLRSIVLAIAAMLIALCRPYKKTYMNVVDILLLVHYILICHLISAYPGFQIQSHFVYCFFIMSSIPFVGFLLSFVYVVFRKALKSKPFFCPFRNMYNLVPSSDPMYTHEHTDRTTDVNSLS